MKRRNKSILIALVLGDGYIQYQNGNAGIKIEHSKVQLPWLIHKANLIHSILGGKKPVIYERDRFDKRTNRVYSGCLFYKASKYFKLLRKWFYIPKKRITKKILHYLDPEGLAIWFMDDGYSKWYRSKKTGKITCQQSYLSTCCSLEEAKEIQEYFDEYWNIHFKYYPTTNGSFIMCANTKDSLDFIELIKPYIIPLFDYKIRPKNLTTKTSPRKGEDIV